MLVAAGFGHLKAAAIQEAVQALRAVQRLQLEESLLLQSVNVHGRRRTTRPVPLLPAFQPNLAAGTYATNVSLAVHYAAAPAHLPGLVPPAHHLWAPQPALPPALPVGTVLVGIVISTKNRRRRAANGHAFASHVQLDLLLRIPCPNGGAVDTVRVSRLEPVMHQHAGVPVPVPQVAEPAPAAVPFPWDDEEVDQLLLGEPFNMDGAAPDWLLQW